MLHTQAPHAAVPQQLMSHGYPQGAPIKVVFELKTAAGIITALLHCVLPQTTEKQGFYLGVNNCYVNCVLSPSELASFEDPSRLCISWFHSFPQSLYFMETNSLSESETGKYQTICLRTTGIWNQAPSLTFSQAFG